MEEEILTNNPIKYALQQRLQDLNIQLPEVVAPIASYTPAVRTGNLVFTSGQLPILNGKIQASGKLGEEISTELGYQLARTCALNALAAALESVTEQESVIRIVKVVGFVASAPGFTNQPAVVNGASDILGQILGDQGIHARSAVGVAELPLGSPVEVEIVVEVR